MVKPVPLSEMASRLGLGRHEHIAIVGGGGKTTCMHALGDQLLGSTVLTSTTKMGVDQHRGRPVLLSPTIDQVVEAAAAEPVVVWKSTERQKAIGVPATWCDDWFTAVDHVVIEADGSRKLPFKAPAGYEPVVPSTVTVMVSVIGADALGHAIADRCHRPTLVAALGACTPAELLSPAAAARVLVHERGSRKEMPFEARLAVCITKVQSSNRSFVDELAEELITLEPGITVVAIAASDIVV